MLKKLGSMKFVVLITALIITYIAGYCLGNHMGNAYRDGSQTVAERFEETTDDDVTAEDIAMIESIR